MRALLRTPDTAEDELPAASLAELQRRLDARDARTLKAVKKAGGYLGVLLQNLSAAYDPASIVLGGSIVDLGELYLQPALQTLNDYAAAANLEPPQVRVSQFGVDAVAVGAAALARHRLTRPAMAVRSNGNSRL
jgi:predicted NBD/HSP70 family sugar kinase